MFVRNCGMATYIVQMIDNSLPGTTTVYLISRIARGSRRPIRASKAISEDLVDRLRAPSSSRQSRDAAGERGDSHESYLKEPHDC